MWFGDGNYWRETQIDLYSYYSCSYSKMGLLRENYYERILDSIEADLKKVRKQIRTAERKFNTRIKYEVQTHGGATTREYYTTLIYAYLNLQTQLSQRSAELTNEITKLRAAYNR